MSADPYDHHCHRIIDLKGKSPTLGMKLKTCQHTNLVMLASCISGQLAARISQWREQLHNSYITSVHGKPTKTMNNVKIAIATARQEHNTQVKVGFSTMKKQAIHPQLSIPQLYHDQMNIIGQHLFDI